jgi:hypothetical protein
MLGIARAPPRGGGKGFKLQRTVHEPFVRTDSDIEAARFRRAGAELRTKVELALAKQNATSRTNAAIAAQQQTNARTDRARESLAQLPQKEWRRDLGDAAPRSSFFKTWQPTTDHTPPGEMLSVNASAFVPSAAATVFVPGGH